MDLFLVRYLPVPLKSSFFTLGATESYCSTNTAKQIFSCVSLLACSIESQITFEMIIQGLRQYNFFFVNIVSEQRHTCALYYPLMTFPSLCVFVMAKPSKYYYLVVVDLIPLQMKVLIWILLCLFMSFSKMFKK